MRIIPLFFLLGIFLETGCQGLMLDSSDNFVLSDDEMYCYGDPDSVGGLNCIPARDVWDCHSMPNGEVKCGHTPDGQDGWECREESGLVVCEKQDTQASGGGGWLCETAEGLTTCTSVVPLEQGGGISPPGGGGWNCIITEFGVECLALMEEIPGGGDGSGEPGGGDDQPRKPTPEPGDFRTQTPGGWGAPAAGNNPGAYRDANFADAFPQGLSIGCSGGHTALFTSAGAIEAFLPAGGTPGALQASSVDPTTTAAGVLAGHVVALSLATGFDRHDPAFGGSEMEIRHLVAASGTCNGMTVQQILDVANSVLGGCSGQFSASQITSCVDAINNNFVDGDRAGGFLSFP